MTQGVEVASAVGTWLAAALALIALFGIIAPFLLWKTLRSERHFASRTIDDPLHLFISSGIPIWYDTRIFRRTHVPRLTDIPQIPEGFNGQRKDECLKDRPSKTGWVGFCSALRAFSLPGSNDRRGYLIIEERQTWLPAHKLWILVFGLLGRYSNREDKGQVVFERNTNRLDHESNSGDRESDVLYGSIGPLKYRTDVAGFPDRLYLATYNRQLRGSLVPDAISLECLFWLAAGCVPLGRKVLDLSMVRDRFHSRSRIGDKRRMSTSGQSEEYGDSIRKRATTSSGSADEGIGPDARDATQKRWESKKKSYEGLDFYYLEQVQETLPTAKWTLWANAMGCDMQAVHTIEKVDIDKTEDIDIITTILDGVPSKQTHDSLEGHLRERRSGDTGHAELPQDWIQNTTGPWIAVMLLSYDVPYDSTTFYRTPITQLKDAYIRRADFHSMALAALSVPVTPRHFLWNSSRGGQQVFNILTLARFKQREILNAVRQTMPYWQIENQAAFEDMLQAAGNVRTVSKHSRRDTEALYQLDGTISMMLHGDQAVRQSIGVLYLTSYEFRSFIHELGASDAAAQHSSIHVDISLSQVECVAASGHRMTWRLDFRAVFPSTLPSTTLPRTRVAPKDLMLAALQAWTRITWFAQPIDATPLINFVDVLSEVVHIAADTNAPSVRRQASSHHRRYSSEEEREIVWHEADVVRRERLSPISTRVRAESFELNRQRRYSY
ncbi:unnamed protein product [Alternaria alternata]